MWIRLLLFLLFNFTGLTLGGLLMNSGPRSAWYLGLQQAPWTPPGWVFGVAWTVIMVCFALYMTVAWKKTDRTILGILYAVQWLLNVAWNPAFFKFHQVLLGLLIISALTLLVGYILFINSKTLRSYSILLLPYFLWLLIATSLNGYIYFNN